ncbi:MAG: hypothetical protein KAT57_10235 [Candidatus Lokiarchaeota archaeon]|nr:hypothetical protein [Candidatus Lokiarchaeota archaeon]
MVKRKFWTVGQIDATAVRGPHEKELEDISKAKHPLFIKLDMDLLKDIVNNELGGKIENIGFNEDWTINIEMFPEVDIHMAYSYFGDEFGDGIEAEFKFYFSGKRVCWVPGEDSATFIDIVMDLIERKIRGQEPFEKNYSTKTELMEKVLKQRSEPFSLLKEDDKEKLSAFLGAKVWKLENGWRIKKEFFSEIFIEIIWDKNKLDIKFSGDKLSKNIDSYHVEFVGIFFLNHILRFITVSNMDKDLPDICYKMFSRYYTKNIGNWDHRIR